MTSYKPSVSLGFAYLWTLMLIAFMGVGLSIGSHLYQTSVQREKEAELLFIGRQFRLALARYHASGPENAKNQYPANLEDLLKDPRFPNTVRHLRRLYRDPMSDKTEWGTVKLQGRVVGVHSLSEQKPIKQDHFEASDASFRGKQKYSEWVFTWPPDLLLKGEGDNKALPADRQNTPPSGPGKSPMLGGEAEQVVPMDGNQGPGRK